MCSKGDLFPILNQLTVSSMKRPKRPGPGSIPSIGLLIGQRKIRNIRDWARNRSPERLGTGFLSRFFSKLDVPIGEIEKMLPAIVVVHPEVNLDERTPLRPL